MRFLNPMCCARLAICMLIVVAIKFGNYTCFDLGKTLNESAVKSCVVSNETGLVVYNPNAEYREDCSKFSFAKVQSLHSSRSAQRDDL